MKFLIAGGGTAGHINPALAIAGEIKTRQPDAEIRFVGTPWGMESRLVPQAGFAFSPMKVAGFQRKISLENIKRNAQAVWYLSQSTAAAMKIINEFEPDVAVGAGGYVSGPIMRQAAIMGVPLVIHEQNAFPGVTTKMLSKYAARICVASAAARERIERNREFDDDKFCVTGNPIRQDILAYDKGRARKELKIDDRPLVLSFGGSLGARAINESILELLENSAENKKFNHIHGYGQYGGFVPERLREAGIEPGSAPNLDVREYINDMPRAMAAADLIICRAGAITLSELEAVGKPSILIPSPNVAENHQYHNAMELARRGAAVVIPESDLTP
ncbi:MAG: UDP-N-acetylglucosamine--N-acetylmuramyl-(pentapeptide) pyrophosphoryl-undecaprenol N-acetylglucosamine transferase, partial [Oscillospiraceae bacterium]|nr:UDP-N-acetylglucosamine--N-acetylmuramyl-(pentapeptide) pyrophosphoryl-undecaprenol N-acetylglucosamine transferase [Oscillospiraceae bacterium]